jgi:hypothetical protein
VHADLSQLTAIGDYARARAAVVASERAVSVATEALRSAQGVQSDARSSQYAAQQRVNQAAVQLRSLAVEAYMGLGFLTPAAGLGLVEQSQTGTVNSPGGLQGSAAADAQEMMRLVAEHERKAFAASRAALHNAQLAGRAAGHGVTQAIAGVTAATSALAASEGTLALVTRAATTPGVAATLNLIDVPASPSAFGLSWTEASGSSSASGGASSGSQADGQGTIGQGAAAQAAGSQVLGSSPASTATSGATGSAATSSAAPSGSVAAGPSPPGADTTTTYAAGGVEAIPLGASASARALSPPTILGPSVMSGPELATWFASTHRHANITVPMAQLAADYARAGQETGVRADVAFAQSVVETGFFSFPAYGQLTPKDNNFAGIGACDSCAHGWTFPEALTGVTAQMQLLDAYASPNPVPTNLIGDVGVGGCCPTWMALAGTWASSPVYGISIMTIYQQMLGWVIQERLIAAGLAAAPKPAPAPTVTGATAGGPPATAQPSAPGGPAPAPTGAPAPASTGASASSTAVPGAPPQG